jgi:thiamine biosynthesis lipoprotein
VTAATRFTAWASTAVVVVGDERALPSARASLERVLDEVDRACSRFRADSELVQANANPGIRLNISPLLAALVDAGLDAARTTDGLVDPTLGGELRAAGYDRTFTLVRTRGSWTLRPAPSRLASWRDVQLDTDRARLIVPRGLELDLGATAKAWAADHAARTIAAETGGGVLVSLGGDVAVAGPPPAHGWAVRIAEDSSAPLHAPGPVVAITGGGLATSSTAVRRWRTEGGMAHHIIDPHSGLPATTPWRTVSVAAATCLDANVASTAAVLLGLAAPAWLEDRGLPARLVSAAGAVSFTGGWPADEAAA